MSVQGDRWRRSYAGAPSAYERPALQVLQGGLGAALRKTGGIAEHAQADDGRACSTARFTPQAQVDQEGGWPPVVRH
jgi:hypothetical protein